MIVGCFWHFFNRGCLTQFLGALDTDWTSFSESIERLMTLVRNKDGIESVIKNLDGKLSEAIMHAMTNGPELEKKVSHARNILFNHCREGIDAILVFLSVRSKRCCQVCPHRRLGNISCFIELQKNFDCGAYVRMYARASLACKHACDLTRRLCSCVVIVL